MGQKIPPVGVVDNYFSENSSVSGHYFLPSSPEKVRLHPDWGPMTSAEAAAPFGIRSEPFTRPPYTLTSPPLSGGPVGRRARRGTEPQGRRVPLTCRRCRGLPLHPAPASLPRSPPALCPWGWALGAGPRARPRERGLANCMIRTIQMKELSIQTHTTHVESLE